MVASYPVGIPCNKKHLEDALIAALSVEGQLFAWQKQAATADGTFHMVVEYCDSAYALRAVQRLNRQQIKSPQGDIVLTLELHAPDISHPSQRLGHMATPTRRSTEQSDIGDALGRMSLNQPSSFVGQNETFAAGVPTASGPFMSSNPPAFGFQPTPLPFKMGGVYGTAPMAFHHGYPAGLQHQGHIGGGDYNTFASTGFGHNSFAVPGAFNHGYNQPFFQQSPYGQDFPNSMIHYHDDGYFHRPSGRRQNAVQVSHHKNRGRQYSNSGAGHHNHVDIHRIKQGIDVRTTVRTPIYSITGYAANFILGHASEHPK